MVKNSSLFLLLLLILSGCSKNILTPEQRKQTAFEISQNQNLTQRILNTTNFDFFSYSQISKECKTIKVYIEGDGLSWISRSVVSDDPTPLNPIALRLMDIDDSQCKIYIARPCQYIKSKKCHEKYWTSHRFNDKIIDSFNEALNNIKSEYNNDTFELIGYSGGGAVALLSATKRDDISTIVTIAGNIDTDKWTKIHNISKLSGSLNPANFTNKLEHIKQYHLIGNNDKVIPKDILMSYLSSYKNTQNIKYKIYDASHTQGWENAYRSFLYNSNF